MINYTQNISAIRTNNRMLALVILAFLIFPILQAQDQQKQRQLLWNVYVCAGPAFATSDDIRTIYTKVIDSYRTTGIPVPIQTEFGTALFLNAGAIVTFLPEIWTGISLGYLYSPAYSNYQDFAGTLKINGSIKSFEVSLISKFIAAKFGIFPIIIFVQPGLNYTISTITQNIVLFNSPKNNVTSQWEMKAWGPAFQGSLGTAYPFDEYSLSFEAGYRFSWNLISRLDLETAVKSYFNGPEINVGASGFIFIIRISKNL